MWWNTCWVGKKSADIRAAIKASSAIGSHWIDKPHALRKHSPNFRKHLPSLSSFSRVGIFALTSKLMFSENLHLLKMWHKPQLPNFPFLDAIASPSSYPCQWVSQSVSEWWLVSDLEIAIASPSFASLFAINKGLFKVCFCNHYIEFVLTIFTVFHNFW